MSVRLSVCVCDCVGEYVHVFENESYVWMCGCVRGCVRARMSARSVTIHAYVKGPNAVSRSHLGNSLHENPFQSRNFGARRQVNLQA